MTNIRIPIDIKYLFLYCMILSYICTRMYVFCLKLLPAFLPASGRGYMYRYLLLYSHTHNRDTHTHTHVYPASCSCPTQSGLWALNIYPASSYIRVIPHDHKITSKSSFRSLFTSISGEVIDGNDVETEVDYSTTCTPTSAMLLNIHVRA